MAAGEPWLRAGVQHHDPEWENAYAAQYKIQYTNQDPAANPTWVDATQTINSTGGTETINFPTVQARYLRMLGTLQTTKYGYSLYELQVYNVPQCGGRVEHYTVGANTPSLMTDNLLGLTWTRTIKTDTDPGSQFTGLDAAAYCQSMTMRLPTQAEALGISGNNNASCAFPGAWNTWTSTVDPQDASETALVNFDGTSSYKVTNNWPGAVLCAVGNSAAVAPAITAQPQSAAVVAGQSATFSVTVTGAPAPTYQWIENENPIAGATASTYVRAATTAADNGGVFTVVVSNATKTITSAQAVLTVTAADCASAATAAAD